MMNKLHFAIVFFCMASTTMGWNPVKVGDRFPMNRLMLDSDGELTSLDDMLAEGRPLLVASNTTN